MSIIRPSAAAAPIEGNYTTYTETSYSPIHGADLSPTIIAIVKIAALNGYGVAIYHDAISVNQALWIDYATGDLTALDNIDTTLYPPNYSIFGKYLATKVNTDNLNIYKDGVLLQTITQTGIGESFKSFSPNGKYLMAWSGSGIHIFVGT